MLFHSISSLWLLSSKHRSSPGYVRMFLRRFDSFYTLSSRRNFNWFSISLFLQSQFPISYETVSKRFFCVSGSRFIEMMMILAFAFNYVISSVSRLVEGFHGIIKVVCALIFEIAFLNVFSSRKREVFTSLS